MEPLLLKIEPFSYGAYTEQVSDFAKWAVEYVHQTKIHGSAGWVTHFQEYNFNGEKSWKAGVIKRRDFNKELLDSRNDNRGLIEVANRIVVCWGEITTGYKCQAAPRIRRALKALDTEPDGSGWKVDASELFGFTPTNRIASNSKIYEMYSPHKWTIYDSRVSIALACLVHYYWRARGRKVRPDLLQFPLAKSRTPINPYPKEFEFLPSDETMQSLLAFTFSSWLLRLIAEILRNQEGYGKPPTIEDPSKYSPLGANWQVYHVEMALWMMGENGGW